MFFKQCFAVLSWLLAWRRLEPIKKPVLEEVFTKRVRVNLSVGKITKKLAYRDSVQAE